MRGRRGVELTSNFVLDPLLVPEADEGEVAARYPGTVGAVGKFLYTALAIGDFPCVVFALPESVGRHPRWTAKKIPRQ